MASDVVIIVCNHFNCYIVMARISCAFKGFPETLDGSVRSKNGVSRTGMSRNERRHQNEDENRERKIGKAVAAQQLFGEQ